LPISCDQLASRYLLGSQKKTLSRFPECEAYFSGKNADQVVSVEAAMSGGGSPGVRAALNISFGAALWLALFIHAVGIEIYVRQAPLVSLCCIANNPVLQIRLTPAESERLRNVSYQRQVEAGMKHPGRAGLTADKLGDSAVWVPEEVNKAT
jgi:hypothetical protein